MYGQQGRILTYSRPYFVAGGRGLKSAFFTLKGRKLALSTWAEGGEQGADFSLGHENAPISEAED